MAGFVYKVIPYNYIESDFLSSWLEKQAKKGLFFTSFNFFGFGRFQKRIPASIRYCILIKKAKQGWKKDLEYYESLGWTLVASHSSMSLHVFYTESSVAQPLQTDEMYHKRKIIETFCISIILLIISIYLTVTKLTDLIAGNFYFYKLFTDIPFLLLPILVFIEFMADFQAWRRWKTGMDFHTHIIKFENFRFGLTILAMVIATLIFVSPILKDMFEG